MAGANAWRQQPGGSVDDLNGNDRQLRSLSSMIDSPQPMASLCAIRTLASNNELESESELVELGEDLALLFSCGCTTESRLGVPVKTVGDRKSSCRGLLADLFPTGFTSSMLSPSLGATAAAVEQPGGRTDSAERKPELEGQQAWACLALSTSASTLGVVASFPREDRTADGEEGSIRQPLSIDGKAHLREKEIPCQRSWASSPLQQAEIRELDLHCHGSDIKGNGIDEINKPVTPRVASPATTTAAGDVLLGSEEHHAPSGHNGSEGATTNPTVIVRQREDELKQALDRLVPRLLQSEEKIKFLEAALQQAKHAESGRNGLIKQAAALQEEAKHLRHRLEKRHAEALEWRETRRSLEDDIARLGAELHSALGRITRLETENRRKDSLLAEARSAADAWAERNLTFESELRHKNNLLSEAEREKKRAWQTTNSSTETAKVAVMRAEAAAKEASDLRNSRRDFNRPGVITSVDATGLTSGGQRRNVRGQSLAEAVAAAAAAASAADGGGGPEATRRGWRPTEADRSQTREDGNRNRTRSMSPDRGRSKDHNETTCTNSVVIRVDNELEESRSADEREGTTGKSRAAALIHPLAVKVASKAAGTSVVHEAKQISDTWRHIIEEPPSQTEVQDTARSRTTTPSGTGRRVRTVFETPSPVARSAGRDGDKQRHDSGGVRGALTGASPAWTDTKSSIRAGSPRATAVSDDRRNGGHRVPPLGGIKSKDIDGTAVASEEGQSVGGEYRDYGKVHNVHAGRIVGETRIGLEERTGGRGGIGGVLVDPPSLMVDPSPTALRGWDLSGTSSRSYPAAPAGQRRGRDPMSSRRSSLSGAGAGVTVLANGEENARGVGDGNHFEEDQHPSIDVDTASETRDNGDSRVQEKSGAELAEYRGGSPDDAASNPVGASSLSWAGRRASSALTNVKTFGADRKQPTGLGSPERSSTVSLASLLGKNDSPRASARRDRGHRESRRSAPFATDEEEDELRPLRAVERRLMLLQMEMSQLEAKQNKLVPKASKTMQARVQMRELDSRIASLANESSKLRRVLREKPWRL